MPRSISFNPGIFEKAKNERGFRKQVKLAEKTGLSKAVISNACNGKPIDYDTAEILAKAVGKTVEELTASPDIHPPSQSTTVTEAIRMLARIHDEDKDAWDWISGNLIMFNRALDKSGGRRRAGGGGG